MNPVTDSEMLDRLLQEYGGDFYRWDKDGIPVLINILSDQSLRRRLGLIRMILEHGTSIHENGYATFPPILFELNSKQPDPNIIKLLTEYGADINRPFEGDTACDPAYGGQSVNPPKPPRRADYLVTRKHQCH